MADGNTILVRRSVVLGKPPQVSDLQFGELAANLADGKLFLKAGTDAASARIVQIGQQPTDANFSTVTGMTSLALRAASGDNTTYGLSYFSVNRPISTSTTTQYASMNVVDLTVTTTIQDPVVFIGNNATSTGPLFDTKFSKCIPNFTIGINDPTRAFSLYLNGVPVSLLYDGFTDPAQGQAQITPDGMIRFNTADAGKTISGTWEYLHKLN